MTNSNIINNINTLIDNLISDAGYMAENDVIYQTKYMDSGIYNNDFDTIYNRLNRLYEKTRYLFELYQNVEYYTRESAIGVCNQIDDLLSAIQAQRSTLKKNTDLIFNVSFQNEYNTNCYDRDGSIINSNVLLVNNIITLPPSQSKPITIDEKNLIITPYDSHKNYRHTFNNKLCSNGDYRTIYGLQQPTDIKEHVKITFPANITFNTFSLKLANCTYQKLKYTLDDNTVEEIQDITVMHNPYVVKSIEFDIVCDNPIIKTYSIPSNTNKTNYINKIKDDVLDELIENKMSIRVEDIIQYSNDIEEYDNILKQFSSIFSGFYNDNQSITTQIKKANLLDIPVIGNPYPTIENGIFYGIKNI